MTIAEPQQILQPLSPVLVDLYLDIHKGIRADLFDVTATAGRIDPANRGARAALAAHVGRVVDLLVGHAEHEDAAIQPVLEIHLPALAEKIASDHTVIDARLVALRDLADEVVDATRAAQRFQTHRLYLELASFTSAYLEHQDVEERVVTPSLEAVIGAEGVGAILGQIIASLTPEEKALGLPIMLPAMNIDDRAEFLGGLQANAPAEVFAGIWGLAGSVLPAADHAALAARLGLS